MAAQAMAPTPMQLLALGLLLVGFAFKVSAVPFHMWTPDAYEGAPPAVTGFMSTGVKAAAFAAFVRVFLSAFEPLAGRVGHRCSGSIAAATMIVGTVVGRGADRASSGCSRTRASRTAAICSWRCVVGERRRQGRRAVLPAGLRRHQPRRVRRDRAARQRRSAERSACATTRGSGTTHPVLAALMTIFLLSLGGFPPLGGFIAKWYVFSAAVKAGYVWLAIIGVLTSVVSVFFYLRIVVMMYMTPERSAGALPAGAEDRRVRRSWCRPSSCSISASCRRASSTGRPRRSRRSSDGLQLDWASGLEPSTYSADVDLVSLKMAIWCAARRAAVNP